MKAFARLICLEEAEPPLSIGVFGGWGSGKSTFMQLLNRRLPDWQKGRSRRAGTSQRRLKVRRRSRASYRMSCKSGSTPGILRMQACGQA
ncbi:P-loop NTPase fold protein [Rhizobium azibense]|uniref:P-loop NTPase fold protein n=1 Tax=Rhizobium azibense TaxID=1136135 RepID=UPI0014046FDA